jgi:prepilin-type N-terminal cleavage/methylation domain-containing protein
MNKYLKNSSGFTLIELIIVIAIIGILATAVISGTDFIEQRAQSVDTGNYNIARNIQSSFEQYIIINGVDDLTYVDSSKVGDANAAIKANASENDSNFTKLIAKGVTKTGFKVPDGTFWLVKENGFPVVKFKIISKRFKTGRSGDVFTVPSDGALR